MEETNGRHIWGDRLFMVLWSWVALRTLLPWLVSFRLLLEGDSYQWGTTYFGVQFHSAGMARVDALLVPLLLLAGVVVLAVLRTRRAALAAPVLVAYLGVFAADSVHEYLLGEPVLFQGDTLGVSVDITAVQLFMHCVPFALAVLWWGMAAAPRPLRSLSPARRRVLMACALIVPLQVPLLMFGAPHGTTDAVGVLMTLSQAALLGWALYPVRSASAPPVRGSAGAAPASVMQAVPRTA